jgi:tellurite resistance protein
MNLLRIVTAMAWSDGELAQEEVDVMLDRFSGLFATEAAQHQQLRQELRDYMMQNIPLEELTAKLQSQEERELVLRLGYEVICSSARTPDEDNINDEEAAAYQKLVDLLGLPPEAVQRVIAEAEEAVSTDKNLIDSLTRQLQQFMQ